MNIPPATISPETLHLVSYLIKKIQDLNGTTLLLKGNIEQYLYIGFANQSEINQYNLSLSTEASGHGALRPLLHNPRGREITSAQEIINEKIQPRNIHLSPKYSKIIYQYYNENKDAVINNYPIFFQLQKNIFLKLLNAINYDKTQPHKEIFALFFKDRNLKSDTASLEDTPFYFMKFLSLYKTKAISTQEEFLYFSNFISIFPQTTQKITIQKEIFRILSQIENKELIQQNGTNIISTFFLNNLTMFFEEEDAVFLKLNVEQFSTHLLKTHSDTINTLFQSKEKRTYYSFHAQDALVKNLIRIPVIFMGQSNEIMDCLGATQILWITSNNNLIISLNKNKPINKSHYVRLFQKILEESTTSFLESLLISQKQNKNQRYSEHNHSLWVKQNMASIVQKVYLDFFLQNNSSTSINRQNKKI